jgi:uncharacterized membrane protein YfcA
MELNIFETLLLLIGGLAAGSINTLAGYGSIITLSLLMDVIGLPANVANGSNRINVLSAGITGTYGFYKNGRLDIKKSRPYIVVTIIGAVLGVYLATIVSNEQFRDVFKYLSVVLLFVILINPKKWVREHSEDFHLSRYLLIPAFLFIGFYGGFIQMGVGLLLLAALVLGARFSILDANAVKLVIVSIYTFVVLLIFWWKNLIAFEAGILLAIGSALGGWLTAHYSSRYPNANLWAYRLLIVIVILVILYQFNVLTRLSDIFGS